MTRCSKGERIFMEYKNISVTILRNEEVSLEFSDLRLDKIIITKEGTDDISKFFNQIFDFIVNNNELIEFKLDDDDYNDLFHDVATDIVNQLNSEVKLSETNFVRIIELTKPS